MIKRELEGLLRKALEKKKVILLIGARQVGKSTLVDRIAQDIPNILYLNGDDPDVNTLLKDMTISRLKLYLAGKELLVIDEAQRVADIGIKLKMIADHIPGLRVIATGSSSFELSSKLSESLTGRKREFNMYPLSFGEMASHTSPLEEQRLMPQRLVYGYYPEVVVSPGEEKEVLMELSGSYLYKDILQLDGVLKADKMQRLVQALARQIGDQISYREIGMLVDLDPKTVEKYIDILERCFIVFRLGSFSRNLRNELKASKKIYFYDLGIRNAVINDFRMPELRQDVGALWENYFIVERLKYHKYHRDFSNMWFWRSHEQREIDLIEERDGQLTAFEMKWNPTKGNIRIPVQFSNAYPDSHSDIITPANFIDYLL